MTSTENAAAFAELLESLKGIRDDHGRTLASFDATKRSFEEAIAQSTSQANYAPALTLLAEHAAEACKLETAYGSNLLSVLADATRSKPIWRSLFGAHDPSQAAPTSICVLDVAQEIIANTITSSTQSQRLQIKAALRLIANCCADNNRNRKHFLQQEGMRSLVQLMILDIEMDTLIPTIYNICNAYEDSECEEAVQPLDESNLGNDSETAVSVSFASIKLAAACADQPEFTTYELLLSCRNKCSNDRREYLAELVEMALQPIVVDTADTFGSIQSLNCAWSFDSGDQQVNTLQAINDLADNSTECRVHMLKATLLLLSNKDAREAFLDRSDDSIWQVIQLACSQPAASDDDEPDDYDEELTECRKHFLKMFYELTGGAEVAEQLAQNSVILKHCIDSLSAEPPYETTHSGTTTALAPSVHMKTCALIILSQACASKQFREQLLEVTNVLDTVTTILTAEKEADILYPAVTIITRLALSELEIEPSVVDKILQSMKRFLIEGGLGLIIPYETAIAYRLLLRNRPERLPLYLEDDEQGSVMSGLVTLFDRTIEAGTKLEVGQFFIDVLRTMFPLTKDMDDNDSSTDRHTSSVSVFQNFLASFGTKIGEILAFVCTKAEPKENRVHGWFGLGMFSVWRSGRLAIFDAMVHHDLGSAMVDASLVPNGPVPQNLRLVLTKMQLCSADEVPVAAEENLRTAAHNLGLTVSLK